MSEVMYCLFIDVCNVRVPGIFSSWFSPDNFKLEDIALPFSGRPSELKDNIWQLMKDFLRSDHRRFWDNEPSLSALFLTDTANFRGFMTSCYHQSCDDISHVTEDMVEFLGRTTNALVQLASNMTGETCTMKKKGEKLSNFFVERKIYWWGHNMKPSVLS